MSTQTYRLINLLLLGALFAGSLAVYPTLPDRIPRHFGVTGEPDAWMRRSLLAWLLLPIIATATAGLQMAIGRAAASNPTLWNVPDKPRFLALTPAERQPIVQRLERFMALVGVMTTALLCLVQAAVWSAATGGARTVPPWALPAAVGVFVLLILVAALRMNAGIATLIRDAHHRRAAAS
ncbi:MAG TPA: DUF1648 domain-containing protein [Longimicrobium sp.]|nr:DUF1648 domain-containing protein [Longimicrobium sp.]